MLWQSQTLLLVSFMEWLAITTLLKLKLAIKVVNKLMLCLSLLLATLRKVVGITILRLL
jgi:hypothetical protein